MNSTQMPVAMVTGVSSKIGLGVALGRDPDPKTNISDITSTRQIRLEMRSPSYWRVTFDHPPLNIFGPETIHCGNVPDIFEIREGSFMSEEIKMLTVVYLTEAGHIIEEVQHVDGGAHNGKW